MKKPSLPLLLFSLAVLSTSLVVTILFAILRGQDLNWDQQNYHIGVPYLLARGSFWESVAPAGFQTYLNPYVIQLQLFGIRHLSPIGFAAVLAGMQSLAFVLAGGICAALVPSTGSRRCLWLALAAFALCVLAPIPLSEAGTTFIDLVTAVPIIAAFLLLLVRDRLARPLVWIAIAGALLGASAALKLTNAIFAVAAISFFGAGLEGLRQRSMRLVTYGLAAAAGFLIVGGTWQWSIWERFGNPVFPFFNNLFRSPDFASVAPRDGRFLPTSVLDIWRYPIHWLVGDSPTSILGSPSAEPSFADARWVFVVAGLTVFLAALIAFPRWRSDRIREPATGFIFAFTAAYLIWLFLFGIHRYLIPIDILCGAVLLSLTLQLHGHRARFGTLIGIAALALVRLHVPDWGHLPWKPHWQPGLQQAISLEKRSIVFLADNPILHAAPLFPPDTRFVEITGVFDLRSESDGYLARQLKRQLASVADNALKILDRGKTSEVAVMTLASHGLRVAKSCEVVQIAPDNLRLCPVVRAAESALE